MIAHVHGGGLVLYATTFHFALAYDMYKVASANDDDVAVAVLAYGEYIQYVLYSRLCLSNSSRYLSGRPLSDPATPIGRIRYPPYASARCKRC